MFFAANNISIAEENSAEENSLRTVQYLSGSNFLILLSGIKNIVFFLVILILFTNKLNAKNCLSFLPYGFNDYYVHLPQNASFCVKEGKFFYNYKTDNYGGRLFYNKSLNEQIQVFGDSQVLGLDVEKIEQHFLYRVYKNKNFVIYAAPNNGPYEVINFLNQNKKILKKKIIIVFNFSVDIFRIGYNWNPKNYVALKDYELDEILDHPLKYNWIIFKNLLSNRNFTLKKYNNHKMQNLFNNNKDEIYNLLVEYFNQLNKTASSLDIEIDLIITKPYWIYSKNKKRNKFLLENELNEKVEQLICNSFNSVKKINNIYISDINKEILNTNDLTFDNRHYKSSLIKLVKKTQIC